MSKLNRNDNIVESHRLISTAHCFYLTRVSGVSERLLVIKEAEKFYLNTGFTAFKAMLIRHAI